MFCQAYGLSPSYRDRQSLIAGTPFSDLTDLGFTKGFAGVHTQVVAA